MNVLRYNDADFQKQLARMTAPSVLFDRTIEERARGIIDDVAARGDDAIVELIQRFQGATVRADQLAATHAELMNASLKADPELRAAIADARKNVAGFAKKSLRRNWSMRNSHGATVGEKFDPFQRVGVYIPGGAAPLVSTALMTIPLAKAAGCKEIVVCTPCDKNGEVNPALLFAAQVAGATEIYRVGGAQAIAAMALGTSSIKRVQKIFGPGNSYVVAAKRLLVGQVAIDLLPGPSELLVLADDSADPAFIASDLVAQAEHGSGHERVWFLTASARLLRAVEKEIGRQAPKRARRDLIQPVLDQNTWLVQVENLDHAIALTNQLAPEHCEVVVRNQAKVAERILTAGAIFLGNYTPTVLGDYVAGPSHTLPTGGAGVSFAGLSVDQFQRRTSLIEYNRAALKAAYPSAQKFADVEGLEGHGWSAAIRLGIKAKRKTSK